MILCLDNLQVGYGERWRRHTRAHFNLKGRIVENAAVGEITVVSVEYLWATEATLALYVHYLCFNTHSESP